MKELSKSEAIQRIKDYFSENDIDSEKTRKIKRLAMAHRIRLGEYRKRFCKRCFSDLMLGKVKISKEHKIVTCPKCGIVNRWKIR